MPADVLPVVAARKRAGAPELLAEILTAPFPAGESPFKIKGNAFRGQIQFVGEFFGDVERFTEALGQRTSRVWADLYRQPYLANRQYDVLPLIVAGIFASEQAGRPYMEWAAERARRQATVDKSGVYRLMLRMAPPRTLVRRIPTLFTNYINFAEVRSVAIERGVHSQFTKVPALIEPWFTTILGAYMRGVMELNRVDGVEVKVESKPGAGLVHGLPVSTVSTCVSWRRWDETSGDD